MRNKRKDLPAPTALPAPGGSAAVTRSAPAGRPANASRVAVAMLLVLLGGLVFVQLYRSAQRTSEVLVMRRDVAAGELITRDDLGTTKASVSGVDLIPASDAAAVLGHPARVALASGALPARTQIAQTVTILGPDEAVVGVAVKVVPAGARAEVKVLVVVNPTQTGGSVSTIPPTAVPGVIMSIKAPDSSLGNNDAQVSIKIKASDAPTVAVAEPGHISLVLLGT